MKTESEVIEVGPKGSLELLSHLEVAELQNVDLNGVHELFRRCSLAVLNCGSNTDDAHAMYADNAAYDVQIVQRARGVRLAIRNAPASAFVDGEMIAGIREHLFAVLRDIVYIKTEIEGSRRFDLKTSPCITDAVFQILRNARVLQRDRQPDLVVCWGGHSIDRLEYDYTKDVGYELGLRGVQICTGCGPGAMKGPMKGATIGHAKQRVRRGRYIGITEPGIVAAEPPNPIVNHLVIMPDIEKRLEAFVRLGHGIIVFPGGVGTTEEILFLMGLLLNPENVEQELPVIFTGPKRSAAYFELVDEFIGATLGPQAQSRYQIIIGDPRAVAKTMRHGLERVYQARLKTEDAFYFNWLLRVPLTLQQPFLPTHENMAALELSRDLPRHDLAANLRRVFSGIVTGNVKEEGIAAIREHGPFEISGEREIMTLIDGLLRAFVGQNRMKLAGANYQPCYRLVV